MLTVLNDIPFSFPHTSRLGRAVVTLEGIALIGDPDYRLVMEAYLFVALLYEDRPVRRGRCRRCCTRVPPAEARSCRANAWR